MKLRVCDGPGGGIQVTENVRLDICVPVSGEHGDEIEKRIGSISCLPAMNPPKEQPHKLPIRTA